MADDRPGRALRDASASESVEGELPFASLPEMLVNRRDFLKLTGGALGLSSLMACSGPPAEDIVPYVTAPPEYTPGKPLYYATALPCRGYGRGVLVECHEGRPTKIEGNLLHPASLGATDATTQAAIRTLWDPHRSRTALHNGQPTTWSRFLGELSNLRLRHQADRGAGLRLVVDATTSPTLLDQLAALQRTFPAARWHHHAPVSDANVRAGARLAFGEPVDPYALVSKADVILALDCDFLGDHPDALRLAAEFAQRREPERNAGRMNRLYAVECAPSITGAMADHHYPLRSAEVHAFAAALAAQLGLMPHTPSPIPSSDLRRLADDLHAHRGRALLLVGARQPPAVHALVHALNDHLGSVGATLDYLSPVRPPLDDLQSLVSDMADGRVQTLLILGANPSYASPVDLDFNTHLRRVPFSAHLGHYQDETAHACNWHVPQAHPLESWSDLRAPDGTATICQPAIAPLFRGRTAHELLAALQGGLDTDTYALVRGYWARRWKGTREAEAPPRGAPPVRAGSARTRKRGAEENDPRWQIALQQGIVAHSAAPKKNVRLRRDVLTPPSAPRAGMELNFAPDPTVDDGRDASNPWLQELPKPITKLTWDNALLIAPATAVRLRIEHEGFAEVRHRGKVLVAPVQVTPGHADGAITLHLGHGRRAGSPIALGHGVNAYLLRHRDAPDFDAGAEVKALPGSHPFATAQGHHTMEGRDPVRSATLAHYRRAPQFARHARETTQNSGLFPPFPYTGYAWAMSINLNTCTGCSACVIACQAENNIASVGKEEVRKGREMHWLRIDRYYVGPPEAPRTLFQPVPCMQCETAPCEPVCPVEASVHDDEGINVQVYNRCIGTRFCSNNCPYKVRRFNFLQYAADEPVSNHQRNPDVTVRMRGVMEKCNYCLQRLSAGRIAAELAGRPLRDGEVMTACQAACPTRAIVFGDLNDPQSAVSLLKRSPRDYALLAELHTKPRTTYLAKLFNPASDQEDGP